MSSSIRSPGGAENFKVDVITPDEIPYWFHGYSTVPHANTATSFNTGFGDTRFAPFNANGGAVHTYYAANSLNGAFMESVLHDVIAGGEYDLASLRDQGRGIAKIELQEPIAVVSFHSDCLPLLNLTRSELIDSPPTFYSQTRLWAQAAFLQRHDAQGVGYTSRLNDQNRCIMLFGQRLTKPFKVVEDYDLVNDTAIRGELLKLMNRLDINAF